MMERELQKPESQKIELSLLRKPSFVTNFELSNPKTSYELRKSDSNSTISDQRTTITATSFVRAAFKTLNILGREKQEENKPADNTESTTRIYNSFRTSKRLVLIERQEVDKEDQLNRGKISGGSRELKVIYNSETVLTASIKGRDIEKINLFGNYLEAKNELIKLMGEKSRTALMHGMAAYTYKTD
jgi:hypothetical protein